MLEFTQRAFIEGADFFLKNLQNEFSLQKAISADSVSKLENEVTELKLEISRVKDSLEGKIRMVETERAELAAREQTLKESITGLSKEKDALERDLRNKMEQDARDAARLMEELKSKMQSAEESSKEFQRRTIASESEFDKQKALLMQKIEFHEKTIEDLQRKDKEYSAEIKNQKKEHTSAVKETSQRYEKQLKTLQEKLDALQEQFLEKEAELT